MAIERGKRGVCPGFRGPAGVFVMMVITLAAGCQAINPLPNFGVGHGQPQEARIRQLLKWHSGHVEVYRDFRTVFTARAVYLSDEIQRLAVDWEARSRLMNPEERRALEKLHMGEETPVIKVLVGFYTPEGELNDLSQENSLWIPYLKNPDGTVTKASTLVEDEKRTAIYMRFLKWDLSWSKLYLICFPYTPSLYGPDNALITMVISGPSGQGEISLKMMPPPSQP